MSKTQTFTASCSNVGGFTFANNFTLYVVLTDRDGNSSSNISWVDYDVYCRAASTSGHFNSRNSLFFQINGETKRNETINVDTTSLSISNVSIAKGTIAVTHNNDGNKTISFSASISAATFGVKSSLSGNFDLEKIPRYTNVYNSERWRTLSSIIVNWSTSDVRDQTQYSLNGGAWTNTSGEVVASDNKSGYYTISGLTPNTTYRVKTRCKRKDSQLWSEAGEISITTYNNATITSAPNFTDEQNPTINYTNPFGANVSALAVCIATTGGTVKVAYRDISKTGTSYTFSLTETERDSLRALTPNSNTVKVRFYIRTIYDSVTYLSYVEKTMTIVNANPQFSNYTYQDVDSKTVSLTGNPQKIVKNYSDVKVTISTANKATAKKKAEIATYRLLIGENSVNKNYSATAQVELSLTNVTTGKIDVYAIDTRNNSTLVSKSADIINYSNIAISSATATRKNNVGSEVTLSFSINIWNSSFGKTPNSIKNIGYRYKKSWETSYITGSTPITYSVAGNKATGSLLITGDLGADGFNISETYNIQLFVSDELSTSTFNITLASGTPAAAIYKNKISLGGEFNYQNADWIQAQTKMLFYEYIKVMKGIVGELQTQSGRISNANISHTYYNDRASMQLLQSSASMTSNKPMGDGYIIHCSWDNSNAYNAQLYLPNNYNLRIQFRACANGVWSSWEYIYRQKVLYDNASGTTGTITLSQSAADFDYLEIFYKDNNNIGHKSIKINSPNGKQTTLSLLEAWTSGNTSGTSFRNRGITISGTSIAGVSTTSGTNGYLSITGTSFSQHTTTNYIYITKVIGYR